MKFKISLVATQVRMQQWAEQIRNCQNRPEDMDVATWCSQNGITKANYYYRLRRVREACLTTIQESETSFVELPAPTVQNVEDECAAIIAAILHSPNGFTLEISNHASAEFIRRLLLSECYHAFTTLCRWK